MYESLLLPLYTADAMQQIDLAAIQGVGIPGSHLMERAGAAVAAEILERYEPEEAVVFCGKGNNGGDGFVVARELVDAGVEVTVVTLAAPDEYKGDARLNLEILQRLGIEPRVGFTAAGEAEPGVVTVTEMADVVVDAIFGTGFTGAAKGAAAAAIELINETSAEVVSIDIASGVGADAGAVHGPAVVADLTVALHAAKVGHFVTPGGAFSGEVVVVPIGIPALCEREADVWLLTSTGLQPLLVEKGSLDHKRSVGTVLVVGGAAGMTGAAHMAAMAALRGGAGLVHCTAPEGAEQVKPYPEVITVRVPGEAGAYTTASRAAVADEVAAFGAVALGPGLGRGDETQLLVRELLAADTPLLIDADGLYALGGRPELVAGRTAPTVLTPHEGELGRLLERPAAEIAAHRLDNARAAAQRANATVVLKGEATIVADPSGTAYIVPTGNPGLATPGTGDVLSGAIAAQLAKGLQATDAACLGAYLHGLAADLAADLEVGTEGMVAGDVLRYLPVAIERLKTDDEDDEDEEDQHHG